MLRILNISRLWKTFRKKEDGTASLEFVFLAPIVLGLFFFNFEVGLYMYRWAMLDRGVDMTVREVMIDNIITGETPGDAASIIRDRICDNAMNISGCADNLYVEMNTTTASTGMPAESIKCVNKTDPDLNPVQTAYGGVCPSGAPVGESEIVYLRACLLVEPVLSAGFGPNFNIMPFPREDGYIQLRSNSAFLNEPC